MVISFRHSLIVSSSYRLARNFSIVTRFLAAALSAVIAWRSRSAEKSRHRLLRAPAAVSPRAATISHAHARLLPEMPFCRCRVFCQHRRWPDRVANQIAATVDQPQATLLVEPVVHEYARQFGIQAVDTAAREECV